MDHRKEELELRALRASAPEDLADRIMRALPERPRRIPFYMWLLRPVRVPVWAAALLLLGLAGVVTYALTSQAPAPAAPPALLAKDDGAAACPTPQVLVRFVLRAPGARQVSLVGDFNDWGTDATPLGDPDENGIWTVSVPLEPGRYQYKFLLDGSKWVVEPDAPAYQPDGFGGRNSLLVI